MRVHQWRKSLQVGKDGEKKIVDILGDIEGVYDIIDVSDDKQYQEEDIDYIVVMNNGTEKKVEVKTDTYDSGNLFYETMSCIETNSIGCLEKTGADIIVYYFIKTGEIYFLPTKPFRKWVHREKDNFQIRNLKNGRYNGSTYTSRGLLIPKRYLESGLSQCVKIHV